MVLRTTQQLLENFSVIFILSLSPHGMTDRKINNFEVSFEPETRWNRHVKFGNVLQANTQNLVVSCWYFLHMTATKCTKI